MNGVHPEPSSPYDFSDDGADEDHHDDHPGDYSTRFEELMSDGENGTNGHEDSDAEEDFIYDGIDADHTQGTYKEQLRDVLGPEHDESDEHEEVEVERSLIHDVEENERFAASLDDEARVRYAVCILVVYMLKIGSLCSILVPVHPPHIRSPS